MVFVAWLLFLGFGLGANWVFDFAISAGLIPDSSAKVVKAVAGLYLFAMALGVTVTTLVDQASLVKASIQSSWGTENDEQNERKDISN